MTHPTLPHILARVDELAKIDERAREAHCMIPDTKECLALKWEYIEAWKQGANSLSPLLAALREAVTALEKECHCDGKLDYTYSKYTPITCRFCEALRNIERLIEGEKK